MPAPVETVTLTHTTGKSEVTVSLHGATITNWKMFNNDLLFLSKTAVLDGSKPIRGGIPIVFPQFGPGALPQHGFARTQRWAFLGEEHDVSTGDCIGNFKLIATDETLAIWPHKFELLYTVTLGMSNVMCQLTVRNTGETAFSFQALLHNYLAVDDIKNATVVGLAGISYSDKLRNGSTFKDTTGVVTFFNEVDRVYARGGAIEPSGRIRSEGVISIGDGGNCDIVLKAVNMPDLVVWNPGSTRAAEISDLHEGGEARFVCAEPGTVTAPVTLEPSTTWAGGQALTLRILSTAAEQLQAKYGSELKGVAGPDAGYPKMDRIFGLKPKAKKDGEGSQ